MPKAKLVDDPTGGELIEQPDEPEQTDVDRVSTMLQSAAGIGRAVVKVWKVENGKMGYCNSFQPSEFEDGDFDMIRQQYGAGVYRIMLYGSREGSNNYGIINRTEITLIENKRPEVGQRNGGYVQPDQLAQAITAMAEGQQRMLNAIVELRNAPPVDQFDQMTKMFTMMKLMREATGGDQQQAKSSISEIMSAIREMKKVSDELSPGDQSEESTMLKMVPQLLEVIKSGMNQPKPQPAPMLPNQVRPVILPDALKTPPPASAAPVMRDPIVGTEIESNGLTAEQNNMKLMEMIKMRGLLQQLLQMAKENKPPSEGAQFIYAEIPDDMLAMLDLPNWFDALILFDENVKPHQAWLTEARKGCMQLFEDAEKESGAESGDTPPKV